MQKRQLYRSIVTAAIEGKIFNCPQLFHHTTFVRQENTNEQLEIPEDWLLKPLEKLTKCLDSQRIPIKASDRAKRKKVYDYYGAAGVIDKIDEYIFDKRLLLVGEDGANLLSNAKPNAFFAEGKYWVNNHAHVFDENGSMILDYIAYFINSISLSPYVTGTAQPKLTQNKLLSILVPVPSLEEQQYIVDKLNQIIHHIEEFCLYKEQTIKLESALPDRLRASILQEAIQGKLVPQNPNDEPASILLDRINNERKKLIKNGKIKGKSLTSLITKQNEGLFYEVSSKSNTYLDEQIPFEIPENWAWARLTDISYSVGNRDNQIKSSQVQETGKFPVISQSKEFIDGYCNFEEKLVIDIPVVMFGDHTKSVKYIDFDFVIGADGTKFHKIIYMNSKYIYYWMQYAANKLHDRGYARHYILLKKELIPIPPLAEQHRIVAKLEQILPEIGKLAT